MGCLVALKVVEAKENFEHFCFELAHRAVISPGVVLDCSKQAKTLQLHLALPVEVVKPLRIQEGAETCLQVEVEAEAGLQEEVEVVSPLSWQFQALQQLQVELRTWRTWLEDRSLAVEVSVLNHLKHIREAVAYNIDLFRGLLEVQLEYCSILPVAP
jgi:hypothetical protein